MVNDITIKKSTFWKCTILIAITLAAFFVFRGKGSLIGNVVANTNEDITIIEIGLSNGRYNPQVITAEVNKPVILKNDGSLRGCSRYVIQPELGINANFANSDKYQFTPTKKGTFTYTCSMGMFKGIIKIV